MKSRSRLAIAAVSALTGHGIAGAIAGCGDAEEEHDRAVGAVHHRAQQDLRRDLEARYDAAGAEARARARLRGGVALHQGYHRLERQGARHRPAAGRDRGSRARLHRGRGRYSRRRAPGRGRLHPAKSRGRAVAGQIDGPDDRRLVDGPRQRQRRLRADAHQQRRRPRQFPGVPEAEMRSGHCLVRAVTVAAGTRPDHADVRSRRDLAVRGRRQRAMAARAR